MHCRQLSSTSRLAIDSGEEIVLKYYVTIHASKESFYYGIEIEKIWGGLQVEKESSGPISSRIESTENLADFFDKNKVTPCQLIYILDDMTENID